jgi:hypothetical protein
MLAPRNVTESLTIRKCHANTLSCQPPNAEPQLLPPPPAISDNARRPNQRRMQVTHPTPVKSPSKTASRQHRQPAFLCRVLVLCQRMLVGLMVSPRRPNTMHSLRLLARAVPPGMTPEQPLPHQQMLLMEAAETRLVTGADLKLGRREDPVAEDVAVAKGVKAEVTVTIITSTFLLRRTTPQIAPRSRSARLCGEGARATPSFASAIGLTLQSTAPLPTPSTSAHLTISTLSSLASRLATPQCALLRRGICGAAAPNTSTRARIFSTDVLGWAVILPQASLLLHRISTFPLYPVPCTLLLMLLNPIILQAPIPWITVILP